MGIERCIESPLKDRFCVRQHVLGLMKLDSSIFKGIVPVMRRPPLRKPHPVWTTTAIRAVAPAADEVVAIRRPPNQAA